MVVKREQIQSNVINAACKEFSYFIFSKYFTALFFYYISICIYLTFLEMNKVWTLTAATIFLSNNMTTLDGRTHSTPLRCPLFVYKVVTINWVNICPRWAMSRFKSVVNKASVLILTMKWSGGTAHKHQLGFETNFYTKRDCGSSHINSRT